STLAFLFGLAAAWLWRRVDERNSLAKVVTDLRGELIEFRSELRAVKQDMVEMKDDQKQLRVELVQHMRDEAQERATLLSKFDQGIARLHQRIDSLR